MNQLIDFFRDKDVNKVLDVGTGTGDFIKVLKQVFPDASIEGVDPNSESLEQARKIYPNYTFLEMVAENLQYEDESFDVASISMALHHLPKINRGLKELKRVVRYEGWLIINELFSDNLNPAQEVHKMYHHFRSRIDRLTGINHRETFRKDEILQMVKTAGISVQFHFEDTKEGDLIEDNDQLELRIDKMKQMLVKIENFPEYTEMKAQIEEFRAKAVEFGFQPATRLVIVGKKL